MTHDKRSRKLAGLLLAILLGGCATTQSPPEKEVARPSPVAGSGPSTGGPGGSAPVAAGTSPVVKPQARDMSGFGPVGLSASAQDTGKADAAKGEKPASKADIYPGTGVFVKPLPAASTAAKPATGDEVMLNFEGADLREVVKAIVVDFLRETYIMDSRVQGVVSLHTTSPIPRSTLLATLETVLRMNGAAIVKEEGVYKVVPAASAVRGSITPQLGGGKLPLQSGYSVQIVPLKFLAAKEMIKILEPYVTDATAIRIDEARNLVILSGTERELRHLMETIDMFDIDWLAGMSVGLFTLQNVDVKTATADLDKVFGAGAQSPLSGIVKLVPIERLNAILVVTPQPKYLEQAKIWIERMDRAGGSGGGTRLFVYSVKNGQAEKLATLINDVFSKSKPTAKVTPAATLAPGLTPSVVNSTPAAAPVAVQLPGGGDNVMISGDVRVIADKDNNALLVLAAPSDYEKIESAIRKLDIVPRQVLVDVTVAEVKLEGELQFGLNWYFANAKNNAGAPSFTNGNNGTLSGPGTTTGLAAGAQYIWSNARVGALATLLQTDSRSKIISSPHIMVTDNQIAKINVGSSISVTTQQQTVPGSATGILTGTTYVATGVILSVTPHIRSGGMITMEIDQQVTEPGSVTSGGNPPISTKSIQSTVTVRSGETMVLGGLISDTSSFGTSGLPGLSQIPVIGGLFGSQGYKSLRTELVMLITPRVVENSIQAREVTDEFRKKLSGLEDFFEKSGKFGDKPKAEPNEK